MRIDRWRAHKLSDYALSTFILKLVDCEGMIHICMKGGPILTRSFQLISALVMFLAPLCIAGQNAQRDFHFGLSGQTSVPLSEQSVIEVLINGHGPFKVFYDTGAAVNILNPEVISQLNLPSSNFAGSIHGLNGDPIDAKPFHATELRIGDLALSDQDFYNVPMPLPKSYGIVGAVGYELFSRLIVKADYEHHQITFFDPAQFSYSGPGQKLDLQSDPLQLIAKARIDKATGNFILDTGALGQVGISFNRWFVAQEHLQHPFVRHYRGVFMEGADGKAPSSTIERIHPVCLGAFCISHLVGELSSGNAESAYAGRIGIEILRRFTTTLDWQHHALYVEKSSQWSQPTVYDLTGLSTDFSDTGTSLVVIAVFRHSPASRAHLKVGDRILLIDNHAPAPSLLGDDPAFLQPVGTRVLLTIQRGNTSLQIPIILKDIL
jgi:hypothetical protein